MDFKTAIDTCLRRKYLDFSGRASRSEYWYYILAYLIGSIVVSLVGGILGARAGSVLSGIYSLALFLPSLAVLVRRLHDTNHSGSSMGYGCCFCWSVRGRSGPTVMEPIRWKLRPTSDI